MIKHINIRLFGSVQGVGFRWATLKKARALGLTGFVRNELDGTLYIEAEGRAEILEKLQTWAAKGPLWARIEKADVTAGEVKNFKSFEIL